MLTAMSKTKDPQDTAIRAAIFEIVGRALVKNKWRAADLAKKAGGRVTEQWLSKGRKNDEGAVTLDRAYRLALALSVPLDDLAAEVFEKVALKLPDSIGDDERAALKLVRQVGGPERAMELIILALSHGLGTPLPPPATPGAPGPKPKDDPPGELKVIARADAPGHKKTPGTGGNAGSGDALGLRSGEDGGGPARGRKVGRPKKKPGGPKK